MDEEQILHRLLVQFVTLKEEQAAMRVVLQSLIESHENRATLLSRFDDLARVRQEVDLGQPMDDQTLERRRRAIAAWRQCIDEGMS
jgi:hypothetical protein